MKKINSSVLIIGLLLIPIFVLANGHHEDEIEEGKKLVESKVSCDKLNDEQLEAIGEYYMELMHPGEAHEAMHEMMGIEEGTEYHEQFHVNMAKMMYCDDNNSGMMGMMGSGGMMNMMGGRNISYGRMGMMSGGMMNMMMNNMMQGMMGNYPYGYGDWSFWNIIWSLFWIGLIVLVIWLIYKLIIKREGISETPIEILKKRFAKGEISKKQFEEMKKEIGE